MNVIHCLGCGAHYPDEGVPYKCLKCGGIFDWSGDFQYKADQLNDRNPGIWRYQSTFGLGEGIPVITLGEGNTPLIVDDYKGSRIAYKVEYSNPSGSYKDRGTSVLMSFLASRGVVGAVEDSSGNAGASFAAYAARAGVKARVYVPDSASGPKRQQIEVYGADLVAVPGPRSAAAEAVKREVEQGAVYASHAYLPFGMAGIATIAYEVYEQGGEAPGSIICPVGHGSLFLGIIRGFKALQKAGLISRLPVLAGVQAKACPPAWAMFHRKNGDIREDKTLAEGVRVRYPVRAKALIAEMDPSRSFFLAIPEEPILAARDELAARGMYVEPTSAIVWEALKRLNGKIPEPIVLILTGSGFKFRAVL